MRWRCAALCIGCRIDAGIQSRPDMKEETVLFRNSMVAVGLACSLVLTLGVGVGSAQAEGAGTASSTSLQEASEPQITPEQFEQGLDELVAQGKLRLISSTETSTSRAVVYGIVDPGTGVVFMTFATDIPKYQDRIWGAMWDWEPALTFNQVDQQAIIAGGAAAVTAMAAAAAAALAETVVGSVISAGAIALVGGAATVYLSHYGHCPASRPTLWVGVLTRRTACR